MTAACNCIPATAAAGAAHGGMLQRAAIKRTPHKSIIILGIVQYVFAKFPGIIPDKIRRYCYKSYRFIRRCLEVAEFSTLNAIFLTAQRKTSD